VANRLKEIDASIERCEHDQALLVKQVVKESDQDEKDEHAPQQNIARAKLAASLKEELETLRKEKAELVPRMKTDCSAQINIQGCIYPSCFIRIGKTEIKILDSKVPAKIFLDMPETQNASSSP
jgi:hypothetical protein